MVKYILQKWKDGLNIGRLEELHYLERQRIATLNACCWVVVFSSLVITLIYISLGFSNKFVPVFIIPFVSLTIWLNYKGNYVLARNVAFFGALLTVTFWSFNDRRTGAELLYIALAHGSVFIYKNRKYAYFSMIICAIFIFAYFLYDHAMPFKINPEIDYFLINTIISFATGGIIFFQAIINADISYHISKKLDKNFKALTLAFENQKISDQKLKAANSELSDFNQKLDFLVKKSVGELLSYQTAIDDNLNSVVTNYEGIILKINAIYLEKTGYTSEEVLGKNIDILKSDYHDEAFYNEINNTLTSGQVWRGESKIKTKFGENLWLVSSILPIKDKTGKIIKFLTISADITEKKSN
jgi:PAS domain S-box-containing protein